MPNDRSLMFLCFLLWLRIAAASKSFRLPLLRNVKTAAATSLFSLTFILQPTISIHGEAYSSTFKTNWWIKNFVNTLLGNVPMYPAWEAVLRSNSIAIASDQQIVLESISKSESSGTSDSVITNSEEERVQRKLLRQQQQREGTSVSAESDGSYLGSLKKEQLKQEQRKKSKVERSKDLCETLGRGCWWINEWTSL